MREAIFILIWLICLYISYNTFYFYFKLKQEHESDVFLVLALLVFCIPLTILFLFWVIAMFIKNALHKEKIEPDEKEEDEEIDSHKS